MLEADPPKRLSYTFDPHKEDKDKPHTQGCTGLATEADKAKAQAASPAAEAPKRERPSRVTIEIEEVRGQVRLTLVHDDFDADSRILLGISKGWPAILSGLKTLLETEKALFPNWR